MTAMNMATIKPDSLIRSTATGRMPKCRGDIKGAEKKGIRDQKIHPLSPSKGRGKFAYI